MYIYMGVGAWLPAYPSKASQSSKASTFYTRKNTNANASHF